MCISVSFWAWALLALVVTVSVSIDLFAHRGSHVDSKRRAIRRTCCVAVGRAESERAPVAGGFRTARRSVHELIRSARKLNVLATHPLPQWFRDRSTIILRLR